MTICMAMTIRMAISFEPGYIEAMSPGMPHRTVSAGEFKAKCLKLMDEVNKTGEPIVITKHGRAVSRLVPVGFELRGIRGRYKGMMPEVEDPSEEAYAEEEWNGILAGWDDDRKWW